MLNHELEHVEGILVLHPEGPLEAVDFKTLAAHVDAYLANNGCLRGVLIRAPRFPGWKDFSALVAHLKFVKDHHHKIEKIAIVADGEFATVMPRIAQHFIHAEIKHFSPDEETAARAWLVREKHTEDRHDSTRTVA